MSNQLSDIGLIGLAVMGQNLALNIADHGFRISVYNRTTSKTEDFVKKHPDTPGGLHAALTLEDFVASIQRPRKIIILVQAGRATDAVIDSLVPLLEKDDIIIDGGNALWSDTIRREKDLTAQNLRFIGSGVNKRGQSRVSAPFCFRLVNAVHSICGTPGAGGLHHRGKCADRGRRDSSPGKSPPRLPRAVGGAINEICHEEQGRQYAGLTPFSCRACARPSTRRCGPSRNLLAAAQARDGGLPSRGARGGITNPRAETGKWKVLMPPGAKLKGSGPSFKDDHCCGARVASAQELPNPK